MLEIRQEISKTSVKKYDAMQTAVCSDGRVRGLLQFYGANRTGRWAGRIVQVQNLPRNHMKAIELARNVVKTKKLDNIRLIWGSVPDALSQLIRTAFIPETGCTFMVADFSAIEARVIAWLAGETWRQEVFATHGKIYEASASAMFGVPIELIKKGNPEYVLRQKGKVAELACIAKGQKVLTNIGMVPIEEITADMLIWDGIDFVKHDGVVFRGIKEVISYDGLTATADHLVWVKGKSQPIRFDKSATCGARLFRPKQSRANIRKCSDNQLRKTVEIRMERPIYANKMFDMRKHPMDALLQFIARKIKRLPALFTAKTNSEMVRSTVYGGKTALHQPERSWISELWRTWNSFLFRFGFRCRFMDDRKLRSSQSGTRNRPDRSKWGLRAREPALGNSSSELRKSAPVYDILNCGPRNRYTVNGALVHNCGYQGGVGALKKMGAEEMGLTDAEMQQIITNWRNANKRIVDLWYKVDRASIEAVTTGRASGTNGLIFAREIDRANKQDFLTITLPSCRKLFYAKPYMAREDGSFKDSIHYWGVNQTSRKWEATPTYGGKLVENTVQAIARDCLAVALTRLEAAGYQTVFHVHDEAIIEVPIGADDLDRACKIMGEPIPWAPGLLLRADGFKTEFYKKED